MADLEFTISQGKSVYFSELPAASDRIRVLLLSVAVVDSTLQDYTTISALLAANTESTFTGYVRKTVVPTVTRDNTLQQVVVDFPDFSWSPTTAQAVVKLIYYYDIDSTDTTTTCVPLWAVDLVTTTVNGTPLNYTVPTPGQFIAT